MTTARSQFHMNLQEAINISWKQKNKNGFVQAQAVYIHTSIVQISICDVMIML